MPSKEDILAMWLALLYDAWNAKLTNEEFERRFSEVEQLQTELECTEKSKPKI